MPTLEGATQINGLSRHHISLTSYPTIVPTPHSPHSGQQHLHFRNILVDKADQQLGEAIAETMAHHATGLIELRFIGGKVNQLGQDDTSWAGRTQEAFVSSWVRPSLLAEEDASFAPLYQLATGELGGSSNPPPINVCSYMVMVWTKFHAYAYVLL